MCFSASASFTAGVVLATVGVLCIRKKQDNNQLMLALVPMFFSIQQFTEGFVWLLQDGSDPPALQFAVHFYLAFALVIWPTWVPVAIYSIEPSPNRKTVLALIATIGLLFSSLAVYYLFNYTSTSQVLIFHMHYDLDVPDSTRSSLGMVHLLPTILPLFITSVPRVPLLGSLILLSHIVTVLFFKENILSVWCFFAALISLIIYVIMTDRGSDLQPHPAGNHEPGS